MTMHSLRRWSPILLCLGITACSNAPVPADKTAVPAHEIDFIKENDVAMNRMMASMEVKPTGDIDRDFARMMIPHHQGAIDMSQALLRHGKSDELKSLARAIIAKQAEEIAIMQRYAGEMPAAAEMDMSGMDHSHH